MGRRFATQSGASKDAEIREIEKKIMPSGVHPLKP